MKADTVAIAAAASAAARSRPDNCANSGIDATPAAIDGARSQISLWLTG